MSLPATFAAIHCTAAKHDFAEARRRLEDAQQAAADAQAHLLRLIGRSR